MTILVTGAAGYIGAHAAGLMRDQGIEVVGVDNFERSAPDGVPPGIIFHEASIHDADRLAELLASYNVDAVMHFAGLIAVGESVQEPLRYYANNLGGSLALLEAMQRTGVTQLVFSSSAAVYGIPKTCPITEDAPTEPISPYGYSKLAFERILHDWAAAGAGRAAVALRYFNIAGAVEGCGPGERHVPETHLIPNVLAVAAGAAEQVSIFGDDYPTADGTCIRDYLHVEDLAAAHIAALEKMPTGRCEAYNLGIGRGYSVRAVIEACERVTGQAIKTTVTSRRVGDPPELFADGSKAQRELGWQPSWLDLDSIVASAWTSLTTRASSASTDQASTDQ